MTEILSLSKQHCDEVAQLHLSHLRTNFSGKPGRKILSAYYEVISRGVGAFGYVAIKQGKVVGFICGVWDPRRLKLDLINEFWYKLIIWSVFQLFFSPILVPDLLYRFFRTKVNIYESKCGYELRPIVIVPSERGTGLAKRLLKYLLNDAHERGYESIFLFAETENFAANNFYENTGFLPGEIVKFFDLNLLHYERHVSKPL